MKTIVVLEQTRGGLYNSIPCKEEVALFLNMGTGQQDEYLQKNYYSKGHGEGANNLLLLLKATEKNPANIVVEVKNV